MRLATLISITLFLVGCANPSIVRVDDTAMCGVQINRVLVPRFEGNPEFVEESTDYFVSLLESQISASVVQSSVLRGESTDIHSGANLAPVDTAIAAAKKVGADALVMGKVTSHNTGGMLNGFSTVRLIDTNTGTVLASFHRPSGMLVAYSEHQCVMAAVKRTANDMATVLK